MSLRRSHTIFIQETRSLSSFIILLRCDFVRCVNLILNSRMISNSVILECKFDANVTFTETKDYHTCMSIRRTVIEHQQAQLTWGIIAIGVLAFLIIFIGCLYCLHRRNVRQMNRKKINNQNIKTIKAPQTDPVVDEPVNSSPEKLLIKRSDV